MEIEAETEANIEDEPFPEFLVNEELFEGYGKELIPNKLVPKQRTSGNITQEEFIRFIIHAVSPQAAALSDKCIMDILADNFSGMDQKMICKFLLEFFQKASENPRESPSISKERCLQLQDLFTSYLRHASPNPESDVSESHCSNLSDSSSLGILNLSDISMENENVSTENFSTIHEQSSIQCDSTIYQHEIGELQHQIRKISEENKQLKQQLSVLEDNNHLLMQGNSLYKKELLSLHGADKELKELRIKNESLIFSLSEVENFEKTAQNLVIKLEKEKSVLEMNIKYLDEKLEGTKRVVDQKQQTISEYFESFQKSKMALESVSQIKQQIEVELNERKSKCRELEFAVKELTESNQSLRKDYNAIEAELESSRGHFSRILEDHSHSPASLISCSPASSSLKPFSDLVTSTPDEHFDGVSLSHEMSDIGSIEGLPMPFCGKKRYLASKIPYMPYSHKKKRNMTLLSAGTRRKNFSKQVRTDPKKSFAESSSEAPNTSDRINKKLFSAGGDMLYELPVVDLSESEEKSNSSHLCLLELILHDLKAFNVYLQNINTKAKSALKIELDIAELEKKLLEATGKSLDLEITSKSGCVPSMPPHSAADSETDDTKRISDSSSQVIRDQISAEINALKTQLIRSHALLSYLQEKEKYASASFSPDASSPGPRKSIDSRQGKRSLQQQKSLDTQPHSYFHHSSQKDSISNVSHRSTPLHTFRSQSCPLLLDELSVASKSTQTDLVPSDASSSHPQRYGTVWNRVKEPRFSECSSTSEMSSKSVDNLECGICEVHPIQEESASPWLPRHRTNSFLTAVVSTPASHGANAERSASSDSNYVYQDSRRTIEQRRKSLQSRRNVKIAQPDPDDSSKEDRTELVKVNGNEENSKNEKSFKPPQRSMRRGSGAGSPNSLTSIPRYPAFDLDEQDEERTAAVPILKNDLSIEDKTNESDTTIDTNNQVKDTKESGRTKHEYSRAMLMPETVENSETESAKGSFECETAETPAVVTTEVPVLPVPDTAFPHLPDTLLVKLGISKDTTVLDTFDEHELESKFVTLSLAFKTDKITLSKRLELHKRQRDVAEKDVEEEVKAIRHSLNYLNLNALTSETRDVIAKIQTHIDIVSLATSKVSARSETYGAVKQEERVSCTLEVMMHYVENLRRLFDKERRELEETKRMLSSTQSTPKKFGQREGNTSTPEEHRRSLRTLGLAIGTVKSVVRRRASIADLHSLPDFSRFSNFSHSLGSGILNNVDTRARRVSALLPFSSSSSVVSTSTSSSPLLHSTSQQLFDIVSRRCSLPAATATSSFSVNNASDKDVPQLNKNNNDMKISVAPSLAPVADEEHTDEEEEESREITLLVPKIQTVNRTELSSFAESEDHPMSTAQIPFLTIHPLEDVSDDARSDASVDADQSAFRVGCAKIYHWWKQTSSLNLLRYCVSLLLAIGAIFMFFMTFVPSDICFQKDDSSFFVPQFVDNVLFKTSRQNKLPIV